METDRSNDLEGIEILRKVDLMNNKISSNTASRVSLMVGKDWSHKVLEKEQQDLLKLERILELEKQKAKERADKQFNIENELAEKLRIAEE